MFLVLFIDREANVTLPLDVIFQSHNIIYNESLFTVLFIDREVVHCIMEQLMINSNGQDTEVWYSKLEASHCDLFCCSGLGLTSVISWQ